MDYRINIEGTVDRGFLNFVQRIDKDLRELTPLDSECRIYRVHEGLRKVKPEAYEPMVVSIGPYHLKNSRLQALKSHKLRYLHSLLERRNESLERYILEMKNLEGDVRKCYVEPIDLDSERFLEMMLLDSCFIVELFRGKTPNPILSVGWVVEQIYYDMVLLENQLPFFLLSRLYNMTKEDSKEETFMERAMSMYSDRIPKPYLNLEFARTFDPNGIKHLLQLVHILCHPLLVESTWSERNIVNKIGDVLSIRTHSAVELQEAGVKFEKVGEFYSSEANLYDVKFDKGLMKVPCFAIGNSTEIFFRNLIAYEQHSLDHLEPKYFTDFAIFMDQLINSEKDVELLRRKGIIVNFLGDDKEVSDLFNKLGDGVLFSSTFHYSDVCRRLNRHCEKTWNKMMARLRRDYFHSPWASISTTAAGVLLLLTLIQTLAAVKIM